jgi:hypothetical protein
MAIVNLQDRYIGHQNSRPLLEMPSAVQAMHIAWASLGECHVGV